MSLQDPTAKMSKSDPDPASRILILDDPATIRRRVKRAVTDSGSEVRYDWTAKPGISNLMEMYSLFTGAAMDQIEAEFGTGGYGRFKEAVAEAVVAGLAPMQAGLPGPRRRRGRPPHGGRGRGGPRACRGLPGGGAAPGRADALTATGTLPL